MKQITQVHTLCMADCKGRGLFACFRPFHVWLLKLFNMGLATCGTCASNGTQLHDHRPITVSASRSLGDCFCSLDSICCFNGESQMVVVVELFSQALQNFF